MLMLPPSGKITGVYTEVRSTATDFVSDHASFTGSELLSLHIIYQYKLHLVPFLWHHTQEFGWDKCSFVSTHGKHAECRMLLEVRLRTKLTSGSRPPQWLASKSHIMTTLPSCSMVARSRGRVPSLRNLAASSSVHSS